MSRHRSVRQEDVTRALRGAAKAGQEVRRVEIHPTDQKIVLVMIETKEQSPAPETDPMTIVL